jgi:site-specific DNA-methyltransferase (adenine-specific)
MEPVHIGDATLYLGDCLDILPTLGPVDAVVTDPPYGINYRSNHNSSRRGKWARWVRSENMAGIIGDDKPFDPVPWLALDIAMVVFGGNYCADRLPPSRCWIVWDKRGDIGKNNQADCELAWTNLDEVSRVFTHKWSGLIRDGEENVVNGPKLHPHQKPVALLCSILQRVPGRSVLDPYMGSGSLLVAAARLGRSSIGIEIETRYFDIACERIKREYDQLALFPPEEKREAVQGELL